MSALELEKAKISEYLQDSLHAVQSLNFLKLLSPKRLTQFVFDLIYIMVEIVIIWLFKPPTPRNARVKPRGRIAVIGAGLTGVSSAAHATAHGFDVVVYESGDRIGGIWTHVNASSGLQLNSLLYRFHPAVLWSCAFPKRNEILKEIHRIWKEYGLEPRTRFNTPVKSVRRAKPEELEGMPEGHVRWIVNDGADGLFDAVVVTVGTCGDPQWVGFKGMPSMDEIKKHREGNNRELRETKASERGETDEESTNDSDGAGDHANTPKPYPPVSDKKRKANSVPRGAGKKARRERQGGGKKEREEEETFEGLLLHSSELDDAQLAGKTVVVVGSGASGVEAVVTALERGAKGTVMVARDDKWIIPRNIVLDTAIAAQPFGREMPLSVIWEKVVTWWNYHGVEDLTPPHRGLFEGTPVVNDEFLDHVRAGRCQYVRGDTQRFTRGGVLVNVRGKKSRPGDEGEVKELPADVIVLATGFKKPDVDFLEQDLFPENYERPNLYLQNFATEDWSVLMTNSAYINAIGTVGHFHIGIYMRILLTFLMDENARPLPQDMKLWVDVLRFVKRGARGGALGFFTYMELTIWILLFLIFRLDRLKWFFFILFGWGVPPVNDEAKPKGGKSIDRNGSLNGW